jgi:hypothetical protein
MPAPIMERNHELQNCLQSRVPRGSKFGANNGGRTRVRPIHLPPASLRSRTLRSGSRLMIRSACPSQTSSCRNRSPLRRRDINIIKSICSAACPYARSGDITSASFAIRSN